MKKKNISGIFRCEKINFDYWRKNFFKKIIYLVCPIWPVVFYLFFYNEPDFSAEIDPSMALMTPFPSSILDEIRFKPTTF